MTAGSFGLPVPSPQLPSCPPAAISLTIFSPAASIVPNPLSESGVPTALELRADGTAEVRHVVGALPLTAGWSEVASVEVADGALRVRDASGADYEAPYDPEFLAG